MPEPKFTYTAYDIGRILTQKSYEQDRSTPEGEQMAYLLNIASLFLGFQEGMNARLCEELGRGTKSHAVFSCPVDLDTSQDMKEAAR